MRIRLLAALVPLVLLASCAAGGPDPAESSLPIPDPSPSSPPVADRPSPRFDAECDTLVPAPALSALVAAPVSPADLLLSEFLAAGSIPRHAAVAQVGGLLCEWSNGEPYSSQTGAGEWLGVRIAILPEAEEGWQRMVEYYGFPAETGQVFCNSQTCGIDLLAEDYWISAEIRSPETGDLAAVQSLADSLRAAAADFGTLEPRWVAPDLREPPGDCATLVPEAVARAAMGDDREIYASDRGGWSLWAEARLLNGDLGCGYNDDLSAGVGAFVLRGGAWLAEQLDVAESGDTATVDGLDDDEWAVSSCEGDRCVASLVAGGNWVATDAYGTGDPAADVLLIAEHVVDTLAP